MLFHEENNVWFVGPVALNTSHESSCSLWAKEQTLHLGFVVATTEPRLSQHSPTPLLPPQPLPTDLISQRSLPYIALPRCIDVRLSTPLGCRLAFAVCAFLRPSRMGSNPDVKCRVAVVGSGMAGLVTAYLLNQDPENRYQVEVFEIVRL